MKKWKNLIWVLIMCQFMFHNPIIGPGNYLFFQGKKLKKIEKITAGEAMKYAVTGGVVDLDEERKELSEETKEHADKIIPQ